MTDFNAADRKSIRRAEKAVRATEILRNAATREIMATTSGRAWMHDLLLKCHIGTTPFTVDPYATAFQCGEANIGLQLWADLQALCPDMYILMMRESHERSAASERTGSEDRDRGDQGPDAGGSGRDEARAYYDTGDEGPGDEARH